MGSPHSKDNLGMNIQHLKRTLMAMALLMMVACKPTPTVVSDPDGEVAGIYKTVARTVAIKVAAKAKDFSAKFPTISISKNT